MPSQPKGTPKAPSNTKVQQEAKTVGERTQHRFHATHPLLQRVRSDGIASLTAAEKKTFIYSQLVEPVVQQRLPLSNRAEREFWKTVSKEGLPIRRLRHDCYAWGTDCSGRDVATYSLQEHAARSLKQARLTALSLLSARFCTRRRLAAAAAPEQDGNVIVTTEDVVEEKARRKEMAGLMSDLYGETTGPLANDPDWDDIVPIMHQEPEDALARIAYPEDYAEAVAFLRAVMAAKEHSPRALRLTALVININPAHYTVWLYRFEIIRALALSVPDELRWLNDVALDNLKNYQIWHHRHLLLDLYVPTLLASGDEAGNAAVKELARSESAFVTTMLAQDAKNYHVWSYRQFMVRRLGHWGPQELAATQSLIEDDVRNNSAWSHRFFLVFRNPDESSSSSSSDGGGGGGGGGATAHDPAVPAATIDREIAYAKEKIALAPQNQSPWNYLRAVLVKAGRPLESEEAVAADLVFGLGGAETETETVKSSHALDYLADVYAARGDTAKARLCLQRLGEKWDPIREGYWKYRAEQLV